MTYLVSRKPAAFPRVRISPLAKGKKGNPSVRARVLLMDMATLPFGPTDNAKISGSHGARWIWVLPCQNRPLSWIDGQYFQNVPWWSIRGRVYGISRSTSPNSVICRGDSNHAPHHHKRVNLCFLLPSTTSCTSSAEKLQN